MTGSLRRLAHRAKPRLRWLWPWIMRWRDLLRALPLHRLPISSRYFGRPKGFYRTTFDFLRSPAARAGRHASHEIFPPETLHFPPPTPLDGGERHRVFEEKRRLEMPAVHVFELGKARFWGHYGGSIISPDDRLLGDLSHDVLGTERHKIFTKLKLPRCQPLAGTFAVLATAEAATNYWHWTFDLLPRFHLLSRAGFHPGNVDGYLVNHTGLPFQLETLAQLGIRPEQIIRTDAGSHFEVERLVVSSLKPSQFHIAPWVVEFLQSLIPTGSPGRGSRRLFVSREHAAFRRLLNEAELFATLEPLGFEKVHCEKLTVREQQRLFSEAETVVAPHGSGLTNLAYCRPQTRVVEIFPPHYVDAAFWMQGCHLGLRHWAYLEPEKDLETEHRGWARQEHFRIDVARFQRMAAPLFEMLATP